MLGGKRNRRFAIVTASLASGLVLAGCAGARGAGGPAEHGMNGHEAGEGHMMDSAMMEDGRCAEMMAGSNGMHKHEMDSAAHKHMMQDMDHAAMIEKMCSDVAEMPMQADEHNHQHGVGTDAGQQ